MSFFCSLIQIMKKWSYLSFGNNPTVYLAKFKKYVERYARTLQ